MTQQTLFAIALALCSVTAIDQTGAQNRRRVLLREQWGGKAIEISANSEDGMTVSAAEGSRSVIVLPRAMDVQSWADSALQVLSQQVTVAKGEEVDLRTREVYGFGAAHFYIRRTAWLDSSRTTLALVGPAGVSIITVPVNDSLARAFVVAAKSAADAQVEMAGNACASEIDATIAKRGKPTARERGSNSGSTLYERLVWKGRFSSTDLWFVWGGKQQGCEIKKI